MGAFLGPFAWVWFPHDSPIYLKNKYKMIQVGHEIMNLPVVALIFRVPHFLNIQQEPPIDIPVHLPKCTPKDIFAAP